MLPCPKSISSSSKIYPTLVYFPHPAVKIGKCAENYYQSWQMQTEQFTISWPSSPSHSCLMLHIFDSKEIPLAGPALPLANSTEPRSFRCFIKTNISNTTTVEMCYSLCQQLFEWENQQNEFALGLTDLVGSSAWAFPTSWFHCSSRMKVNINACNIFRTLILIEIKKIQPLWKIHHFQTNANCLNIFIKRYYIYLCFPEVTSHLNKTVTIFTTLGHISFPR